MHKVRIPHKVPCLPMRTANVKQKEKEDTRMTRESSKKSERKESGHEGEMPRIRPN